VLGVCGICEGGDVADFSDKLSALTNFRGSKRQIFLPPAKLESEQTRPKHSQVDSQAANVSRRGTDLAVRVVQ